MAKDSFAEESISHERWLVSYADLLTLLLAFFVVMYSIARLPEADYKELTAQLSNSFTSGEVDKKPKSDAIVDLGGAAGETSPAAQVDTKEEENAQQKLGDTIQQRLEGDNSVRVSGNEEWLEIELDSNLLFGSGGAKLREEAKSPLKKVAEELSGSSYPMRIEGFTDNVPIKSRLYASNWELSFARATAVLRYLSGQGVAPRRMSAIGYGEFYPLADNNTNEGRAQNRRVLIKVAKNADPLAPVATETASGDTVQPEQKEDAAVTQP
ncbi:MAG: OmpA family protein, partial [Pseudomonadales bacterium]